jgi:hypothetical protein
MQTIFYGLEMSKEIWDEGLWQSPWTPWVTANVVGLERSSVEQILRKEALWDDPRVFRSNSLEILEQQDCADVGSHQKRGNSSSI